MTGLDVVIVGVRNQREEARALDGGRELALVLRLGAGDPARHDLAVLGEVLAQGVEILVIDLYHVLGGELAEFAAAEELGHGFTLLRGDDQAASATPDDALIAISFKTYNRDTARIFPELVARGVPAISITDSLLSPIVGGAKVVFEIPDMPEAALRTMVAPMCLAQSIAVGLTLAQD